MATGSGIAITTGLSATEPSSATVKPGTAARSRTSQFEESEIQTSGTVTVPLAASSPLSDAFCARLTAAATSAGSVASTCTVTHWPCCAAAPAARSWVAERTSGAISGAAATVSLT